MKKKILAVLCCFAVIASLFVSSFSVSAAESGTWYRRWVDSTNSGAKTYWMTWETGDRQGSYQLYCPGTRFERSPCGGFIYDVYRPSSAATKTFRKFCATVDFGRPETISSWIDSILIEPGTRLTVTVRGYLEGDFDWDATWYQIFGHIRNQKDGVWQEPVLKSLMTDENGNLVNYGKKLSKISDTEAAFYLNITINNNTDMAAALQGFDIYFETDKRMSSYKFTIYDVEYKHSTNAPTIKEEYGSIDSSSNTTIRIDGFFSFLNKPLNNILTALRAIGSSVWSVLPSSVQEVLSESASFFKLFISRLTSLLQTYVVQPISSNTQTLVSNLKTFVSDPLGSLKTLGENIWNSIKSLGNLIWNALPPWLQNSLTAVSNFVSNFASTIGKSISDFFTQRFEDLKTLLSNIGTFLHNVGSAVSNGAKAIWTAVQFIATSLSTWAVMMGYLPGILAASMIAVVSLAIIKLVFSFF